VAGIAGALANTRLFSLCSTRELRKVAKLAKIRRIPKGTRLMTEGEDGDSMYVILTGMARVSRNGRRVALIGGGDAVGELALLARSKRNATVDADSDLEVAEISRRSLSRLVHDVPSFSLKLLEAMAARVRELDSRLYP
jgi:CRP-like cAMP-binding protein